MNSGINQLTARHDESNAMARGCSATTLRTGEWARRAAIADLLASTVGTGLVSDIGVLHFEFSPGKSGTKSAVERLYRSLAVGFTPAAFNAASASESRLFGVWANVTSALGKARGQRTLGGQ
jgi:hypothetical protein